MKAPTTLLVERATARQSTADGLRVWRETAQPHVSDPLVDACPLARPGSYGGNFLASQFGMAGRLAARKMREHRAGGLPPHFMVAITATEIVVLEREVGQRHGRHGTVGAEVARWNRSEVSVTWSPDGPSYAVRITAPGYDAPIQCQIGTSPLSVSFLELMADPARQTPAVA